MHVAIVHEWLHEYWGSECVLEQMLREYSEVELYSVVDWLPQDKRSFIQHKKVTTSFIRKLPFSKTKYKLYLPARRWPWTYPPRGARGWPLRLVKTILFQGKICLGMGGSS